MSIFTAAANDEDGDTIKQLREENEQLRQSLQAANYMLVKVSKAGAHYARAASCLRETVIRWAARAEQAEDMLEAIGAGGVGKMEQPDNTALQEAARQARDWIAEHPDRRPISAGRMVAILTNALAAAPQPPAVKESLTVEQPQVEQEPVAWINPGAMEWGKRQCEKVLKLTRKAQPEYDFTEPLYTRPPARQPLTDAQIDDHMLALLYDGEDLPDPWDFKRGVRAAERAHGIGGEA